MAQLYSLFVARESPVHRLNPLTKLTLTGLLLVAGLFLPGVWTNYLLFLAVVLPLSAAAGVGRQLLGSAWKIVLPFAISLFLIQGFLWPQGTPVLHIGPLSLKAEGLRFAVISTGRILVIVSSFVFFSLTTRPDHLMNSLSRIGFPTNLAYVIVATIQIVPRFQSRAATILDAQRARGLETEGGLRTRARAVLPLVIPLVLSSLIDVEERALAVEARAFNRQGPKTFLVELPDAAWEPTARWLMVAGMFSIIGLRIYLAVSRWQS
jgi:energy-coupling factor transport system permease protein